MMETPRHIAELAAKRLADTLTADEHATLEQWADSAPAYRAWLDALTWERLTETLQAQAAYQPVENVWENPRLWQHIQTSFPKRTPVYRTQAFRWMAAAVVLLAVSVGLFLWQRSTTGTPQSMAATEILPGGNRATLTLADGRTVDLSEAQSGIVIGAEDITYDDGASLGLPPSEELVLTTPKGGTYQVRLPDGSTIWLNASSTLRYPSRFSEDERVVELTGEAYFDVRHETSDVRHQTPGLAPESHLKSDISHLTSLGRPFRVVSKGQRVEVLGTQFNISAYADESETKTTLVAGSVRLQAGATGKQVLLAPGEQGILQTNGLTKQQVNVQQYTAWRNGRFSFDGKPFDAVMRELERWYDIDIRYEGAVPDKEFYGDAFRSSNLAVVLRMLESAELAYRMEGRTLTIINKQKE